MCITPIKGWGKGTEALDAVQECIVRHLTVEDSLTFLKSSGFKISKSKYHKIKRYIEESAKARLNYIISHEFVQSHLNSIDTINLSNKRLWEFSRENKGTKEELKALELISQNIKLVETLRDSSSTIASLAKMLDNGVDDVL